MSKRKLVLLLLASSVLAPIVLYRDTLGSFSNSAGRNEFLDDTSALESSNAVKEPVRIIYPEDASDSASIPELDSNSEAKGLTLEFPELSGKSSEHKSRVLSATYEGTELGKETDIQLVADVTHDESWSNGLQDEDKEVKQESIPQHQYLIPSDKTEVKGPLKTRTERQSNEMVVPDARVRLLRDQLIRAKVFLGLGPIRSNAHYSRELRLRIREIQRLVGDATKDSELPRNANERLKAMEQTLAKGKQIQDDCAAVIKKLRALLHSTEEQLRAHKKQALFLTQLAAKTLPKGLHCLPLRLSTEYYALNSSQQQFPNQKNLEDPKLFHYALFSDNILAAAVVVNSTVFHAKEPAKHVFHMVTDKLNYAAMRMWFLANPPGRATIEVQSIEDFTWLNSSYSPVLKQLGTPSMIDYYFRAHKSNSDSNLKFRNPKYLSILNHLRFYLPEIFPKLNKVLFLDDDIVVRKDLTGLWTIDLKGKVNGAVETCGENFHRFDRYLNFSNPLISKNFDPHACGWAYGMNIFDLAEWRKQNITSIYHSWQKLNHDRQLWKLGTLPPGLITFWKKTYSLDRSWHVLGLGYNPTVNPKDIERAAVIHYNGNMKPWLEIGIPKYRRHWTKFIYYDQVFLRDCNLNP
ncbi:hypothetical protein ACLOJK_015393 [Asimina triloba]